MSSHGVYQRIMDNLAAVIQGKPEVLRLLSIALLARGNVLMEDVPGVGKTTLAKTLARTIKGDFKRVQFTPDLLPTDILGCSVYNPKQGDFRFERGPVFTNILLADEINRASPRAQSALLEAMSEQQVTIEGNCYPLPQPFVVIATQNPVEFRGTYPLPEAQLDRFAIRLNLGYPEPAEERKILTSHKESHPLERLEPAVELSDVVAATEAVSRVAVEEPVVDYILALVEKTRSEPRLRLGVSPRGSLALFRTCQALAFSEGRDYVIPDDVKELAVPVLAHRLLLDTKARYSGISKEEVIQEVMARVEVPA